MEPERHREAGIAGNSTLTVGGQVVQAHIGGAASGVAVDSASTIAIGNLKAGLAVEGDVAGVVDVENSRGAGIRIDGDLTGSLLGRVFGNVSIFGRFTGRIGDASTTAGARNLLRITTPAGGIITPPNAFARYVVGQR